MPSIRKIRIVNFRFNDGAKLIPDEIFCTENAEGKPVDTLLNLDNGGGKSVIVQLLLQPVCPKAKVQNRNISDYFQKGTDHAFVLIEWALDGSSNSLLTGIALAASTTADDENESRTVRFYTFIHDYTRTGDKLDLISLPLSERTGGHIRPLSFDELRKYLQNRKVEYYPSDSLRRYHKRLEEYGILHTEWENILVRINSVEGGITKFFEEYRTADRLLDKFIIPGVMPNDTASSEALEEMFVNYADSYSGQEENLRLQSQITAFTEKLQGILPLIKNMWDAEDAKIQAIRLLADRLFTLDHNIRLYNDKRSQLEKTASGIKEKLHHIKAETASEAFYSAEESYDKAAARLTEDRQKKEAGESRRDRCAHTVSVLNAAKEYAELLEQQNDEKALTAQIRELDNGTRDSRILSLKYSLSLTAAELKKQTEAALSHEKDARKEAADKLRDIQETVSRLTSLHTERNTLLNRTIGSKNIIFEQIDKGLTELALHITVMLDGEFSKDDTDNIRLSFDKQIKLANDEIGSCQNEETQLGQELDAQDEKRAVLLQSQADQNIRLKQNVSMLENYKEAYNAVLSVLEHLSIPADRLFTDEPAASLDRITAKLRERLKQTERSAELLSEQVRCTEAGQLHLSKAVIGFLQETGISYQTGEQYLKYQSQKIRDDILATDPLTAYAVIVSSEKDRAKLLSQATDIWLPAVVPIYTRSELADIAEGKRNDNGLFLSAFDKEYFRDADAYKEMIKRKLEDAKAETEHILHHISEWQTERDILSRFTYTADTEERLQGEIASCRAELLAIQDKLSSLDKRKAEIRRRSDEIRELKARQLEIIHSAEKRRTEFERICANISQYEELCKQTEEIEADCRRLSRDIGKEKEEERGISVMIQECDGRIGQLGEKMTEYQALADELNGVQAAEILTEDYSAMLAEYRLYQENYSADRQRLQKQLQKIQDNIRKKEKAVLRFHISQAEYESAVYSDEAYDRAEEQLICAQDEYEKASEQYSKAVECHAKAESRLEQAKAGLAELHTELLPRSEVGSDHKRRAEECEAALNGHEGM